MKTPDCFYKNQKESDKQHTFKMFDKMLKTIKASHNEVCSVIIEPLVQCAGYMRMYHPIYLTLLKEACMKYNIPLS